MYHFLSNVSRAIQWAVFRNRIFAEHINAIEQIISIYWPADKNDLHLSLSLRTRVKKLIFKNDK